MLSPDFNKQFKLAIDTYDIASGAVLMQENEMGVNQHIAYFSKKFSKHELYSSTIEKE